MIITTVIVCFLLAFLPLVISTFSIRYAANIFSKSILALSVASFLLGLAQSGLILGLSYGLFPPSQMKQAPLALQYVSISGGAIMIVAGILWVGYFRTLMKGKSTAKQAVRPAESQPVMETAPRSTARARRASAQPERDWFSDEVPDPRVFKLAAVVPRKSVPSRRQAAQTGESKTKSQRAGGNGSVKGS